MLVIRDLESVPEHALGSVLALGNFDGLHTGHQYLLQQAKALAEKKNAPLAVMSFEPHPRRLFNPGLPVLRILPLAQKLRLLEAAGVHYLFLMRFNRAFASITAQDFVGRILAAELQVKGVVTGDNFIFGHQRSGDASLLTALARDHGFEYLPVMPLKTEGEVCSSTRVREALKNADMPQVAALLGRPYQLNGRVIHGDKRGRLLGFPTANIRPSPLFLPAFGVYAVTMDVEGKTYSGVANLGTRPMYHLSKPLLEVHCFDMNRSIYGAMASVALHHYLRPEMNFDAEEALMKQMQQDAANAKALLAEHCRN